MVGFEIHIGQLSPAFKASPNMLEAMSDDRLHHPSFAAKAINREGIPPNSRIPIELIKV